MDDCVMREKLREVEGIVKELKQCLDKDDNVLVNEVRAILSRNDHMRDYVVSEGNDKDTVMIDLDDSVSRILTLGSDATKELNECGYNIVAFDHQKYNNIYRIWVVKI